MLLFSFIFMQKVSQKEAQSQIISQGQSAELNQITRGPWSNPCKKTISKKLLLFILLALLMLYLSSVLYSVLYSAVQKFNDQRSLEQQERIISEIRQTTPRIPKLKKKQLKQFRKRQKVVSLQKLEEELEINKKSKERLATLKNKQLDYLEQLKFFYKNIQICLEQPQLIQLLVGNLQRGKQIRNQLKIIQQFMRVNRQKDQEDREFQYFKVKDSLFGPMLNDIRPQPKPRPLYLPSAEQISNYVQKKHLIICTAAGRKPYLQVLYQYLSKKTNSFYKWHLYLNSKHPEDMTYIKTLAQQNDWIEMIKLPSYNYNQMWQNIKYFWKFNCQKDKIYLRLDDDIVWMSQNYIDEMFQARINNPNPMFIYSNIINNALIDYLHQRAGNFILKDKIIEYAYEGNGRQDVEIAKELHLQFLESAEKNQTDKWKNSFSEWYFLNYERVSINSLIYFGSTIASIEIDYNDRINEEQLFSADYSHHYQRKNIAIGHTLCVHEAFFNQRQFIDKNNSQILKRYRALAGL